MNTPNPAPETPTPLADLSPAYQKKLITDLERALAEAKRETESVRLCGNEETRRLTKERDQAQADCAAKEVRLLNLIEEAGKELERLRAGEQWAASMFCQIAAAAIPGIADAAVVTADQKLGPEHALRAVELLRDHAKDLRAQRDQAVSLARECEEVLKTAKHAMNYYAEMWSAEELGQDIKADEYGKKVQAWDEKRKAALAKFAALNPPPSDDTLKV